MNVPLGQRRRRELDQEEVGCLQVVADDEEAASDVVLVLHDALVNSLLVGDNVPREDDVAAWILDRLFDQLALHDVAAEIVAADHEDSREVLEDLGEGKGRGKNITSGKNRKIVKVKTLDMYFSSKLRGFSKSKKKKQLFKLVRYACQWQKHKKIQSQNIRYAL